MDNFCNKTNIMQMREAVQTGIVVAGFRGARRKLALLNHAFEI